jgi:hypothetical protein
MIVVSGNRNPAGCDTSSVADPIEGSIIMVAIHEVDECGLVNSEILALPKELEDVWEAASPLLDFEKDSLLEERP